MGRMRKGGRRGGAKLKKKAQLAAVVAGTRRVVVGKTGKVTL